MHRAMRAATSSRVRIALPHAPCSACSACTTAPRKPCRTCRILGGTLHARPAASTQPRRWRKSRCSASRCLASTGRIASRFRRRPARLAAAAPSAHQGGRITRAHSVTSTVCHAAVLHQAALGTTSAGRLWHSSAFKYSTTATVYVALCRLPFWT
jgi:hypothetical protein